MSATLNTYAPTTVLCDTRPRRGKHRTRRSPADRVLVSWRAARVEFAVAAAAVGAVLASVIA